MNPVAFHSGGVTSPATSASHAASTTRPSAGAQSEQTRAAVLDAATRLFSKSGWAGTGVRDIAPGGGGLGGDGLRSGRDQGAVLEQALDVAIVGDDEPVDVAARPEFQATPTAT